MTKTHQLDVRAAQPTDAGKAADILTLNNRSFDWMPQIHTAVQDIDFLAEMIDQGWVTVATKGHYGPILGFIARDKWTIHSLYVHPEWQSKGIGKALLDLAKSESPALKLWTFEANTRAQEFYLREGFGEEQRSDGSTNDEKLPDIFYVWPAPELEEPAPEEEDVSADVSEDVTVEPDSAPAKDAETGEAPQTEAAETASVDDPSDAQPSLPIDTTPQPQPKPVGDQGSK